MFSRIQLKIVLALSFGVVVSAQSQQRGEAQKPCLTPRAAFEDSNAKVPLCKSAKPPAASTPTNAASTPSTANGAAATATGTAPSATATSPSAVAASAEIQKVNRSGATAIPVSLEYAPLTLKYSIEKKSATGRDWTPANTDSEFHTGDRIRLVVEAGEEAYLYVYAKGASGKNKTLFPDAGINSGKNVVPMHHSYDVPSEEGFVFVAPAGQERLTVFLSRKPIQDLEGLNNSLDKGGTVAPSQKIQIAQNIDDGTLTGIRAKARDLEVEIFNMETVVANGNRSADDLVWADVNLTHR
jgi:hypothetical protein